MEPSLILTALTWAGAIGIGVLSSLLIAFLVVFLCVLVLRGWL